MTTLYVEARLLRAVSGHGILLERCCALQIEIIVGYLDTRGTHHGWHISTNTIYSHAEFKSCQDEFTTVYPKTKPFASRPSKGRVYLIDMKKKK